MQNSNHPLQLQLRTSYMTEQDFIDILENQRYTKLWIKQMGYECFLIVEHSGKASVYVKKNGERLVFRHSWQFEEWLKEKFDIDLNLSNQ